MSDSEIELDIPPVSNFNPAELMARMGYIPGQGLGAGNQGITEPLEVVHRPKRAGLGSNTEEEYNDGQEEALKREAKNKIHILEEVNGLKAALAVLDEPVLDIQEYVKFSRLESWDELQMWHGVQHSVESDFRQCKTSEKVAIGLIHAQSCLPRSHYTQLLKLWLEDVCLQDVKFLVAHKSLFAPVLGIAATRLAPDMLDSPDLELALEIPQFSSAIAEYIAHHQLGHIDGVSRFLEKTNNYQVLPIRGSFTDQLEQADKFRNYPVHFSYILTLFVLPAWIGFVRDNIAELDHDTVQAQIHQLRSRGVPNGPIHHVLEMINCYLDTGRLSERVSFSEVIASFCQLRNYSHIQTGADSGTIEGKVDWFVVDDELHATCTGITAPIQIDKLSIQVEKCLPKNR